MGDRVKDHAAERDPRTSLFVSTMLGKGIVSLFILTPDMIAGMPVGLTTVQFLCVLEQYLFFLHRPLVNGVFVATPGVS
jgi:hypothetical protein